MRAIMVTIALILTVGALPRDTAAEAVDLELVLAVDVSGSIDLVEAKLQREGYLKALTHPSVIAAITSGRHRRVAIAYMEWAGELWQYTLVDWTVVRDAATARAFAGKIGARAITTDVWTSISGAIDHAVKAFAKNPHKGSRRVLDISGNGRNNSGGDLALARARALALGITINGLPIMNDRPNPYGVPIDKKLDEYYKTRVIGGRGAFIIVARGFEASAEAIRAKLVREFGCLGLKICARDPQRWRAHQDQSETSGDGAAVTAKPGGHAFGLRRLPGLEAALSDQGLTEARHGGRGRHARWRRRFSRQSEPAPK